MARTWRARVTGLVSYQDGSQRKPAPDGDYTMTETTTERYELSLEGGPTFVLTLMEVAQLEGSGRLSFPDGDWPEE